MHSHPAGTEKRGNQGRHQGHEGLCEKQKLRKSCSPGLERDSKLPPMLSLSLLPFFSEKEMQNK